MTREEAIRQIRDNIDFRKRLQEGDKPQFFDAEENEKDIEAFDMAIRALSTIGDIKAEIEAKAKEREFYLDAGHPYNGLYEALKIIDKHINGKESE